VWVLLIPSIFGSSGEPHAYFAVGRVLEVGSSTLGKVFWWHLNCLADHLVVAALLARADKVIE
jgi:hypothetical protein